MGKGSKERPRTIPYGEYSRRWEAIFGKKEDEWDEKRVDIIGQNGNEGTHYDEIEDVCPCILTCECIGCCG